jgi:hypothetical protein
MRSFKDVEGNRWEVVLGRASWGAMYALFVPIGRSADVRQTMLRSDDYISADRLLDEIDDHALQALFDQSTVKED